MFVVSLALCEPFNSDFTNTIRVCEENDSELKTYT